jgi:hypothetical protein
MVDSSARAAAALEISACFAMCSISSVLFTWTPCVEANFVEMSRQIFLSGIGNCCIPLKPRAHPMSIRRATFTTVRPRILVAFFE